MRNSFYSWERTTLGCWWSFIRGSMSKVSDILRYDKHAEKTESYAWSLQRTMHMTLLFCMKSVIVILNETFDEDKNHQFRLSCQIFSNLTSNCFKVSEYFQINVQIVSKLVTIWITYHCIRFLSSILWQNLWTRHWYAPNGDFASTEKIITYPCGHGSIALVSYVNWNDNFVQFTCNFFIKIHTTLHAATPPVRPQVPIKTPCKKTSDGEKWWDEATWTIKKT